MKINNWNQLRTPVYILGVWFCLVVIFSCKLVSAIAEDDPNNSTKKTSSAATEEKSPRSDKEQTASKDPNTVVDEAEDDDDGIFDLKISTYISINKAYGRIFTPELITEKGLVKYSTLKRKRFDVIEAKRELKKLNPVIVMNLSREERIAFWINTYNFCTIELILENYPIVPKWYMIIYPDNSIMQIPGAWDKVFHEIQREEYTLHEIERDFLLDRYKDPRICFALSNATIGGPSLRNEPYEAKKLDKQLDDQVRQYLSTDKGMRWDKDDHILYLSNVFQIYKEAFLNSDVAEILKFRDREDKERVWLNFILPYLPKQDVRYLEDEDVRIKFIDFDWHLNEAP